ncbi:MAG: hypothetical protein ACKO4Z_04355 [Planctomycetota bacterium]
MPVSLLVITIDRLPAWIVPAYGATWVAMPALDRLAARGVVFDGLLATSADPRDAARSLLGGLAALPGGMAAVVTDDAAVTECLAGGEVTVVSPAPPRQAGDEQDTNLGRLFAAAQATLAAGRQGVVWCHASSLGHAWDAPDEFREAYLDPEDPPPPPGAAVPDLAVTAATDPDLVTGLRHVFAGQLTLLDRCLGRLVAAAGDGCTILFAGLRGMPLGLHGHFGPRPAPPFGELVRLPAVLVDASGRMAGQRFGGLVVPADLGATVAAALGIKPAAAAQPWDGHDLGELFATWSAPGRDRVITATAEGVAVTTPGWRLVMPSATADGATRPMLFAQPDDCFELCDVANRSAAVCDELRALAAAAHQDPAAWTKPLSAAAVAPA